ncbi:membrane protein [Klebsiella aerogenes]|nr:membrane protein [Klebsiella aerogenes]
MTSQSAERIGGWLLAPLAWLLVALLSASLSLLFFANALMSPQTYTLLRAMSAGHMALWVASLLFALAMWYYTLWLTIAFFKRRSVVPKHYIIWLLITLLLAIKAFCLLAGLGCACPASAAVSAAGRCAAGALFSPFAAGKTDFC